MLFLALSAIEYAVKQRRIDFLSILIGAIPGAKNTNFNMFKDMLINSLETLPNLSMEINFHCDSSFIPFVKSFTPSDTYKVI